MAPKNDSPKTTLFHSELVRLGEVQIEVLGEVKPSKFAGRNEFIRLRLDGRERTYEIENASCAEFFAGQKGARMVIRADGSREQAVLTWISDVAADESQEEPARTSAPPARRAAPAAANPPRTAQAGPPARTSQPPAQTQAPSPASSQARQEPPQNNPPKAGVAEALGVAKQPPQRPEETPAQKVGRARAHANKVANLWLVALSAADFAKEQAREQLGIEVNEMMFGACVSTICIQLEKDGFHHSMPTGVIQLRRPPAPAPEPPKETPPAA